MTNPTDEPEVVAPGPDLPPTAHGANGDGENEEMNVDLALDIDPDLLEAALAAVRPRRAPPPEAKPAVRKPEAPDPRIVALHGRLREQAERMAVLEESLRRDSEARATAEAQLAELRASVKVQIEDFDRFRQRARKEKEDAERVGEERILRQFLDSAENIERAWQHAQINSDKLITGLNMIVEQFRSTLRKCGVERIVAGPGTAFDPEVHEAVLHVQTDAHPAGAIVDEAAPGFRFRGKLFRAARVTVAAPSTTSADTAEPDAPSVTFPAPPESASRIAADLSPKDPE